MKVEPPGLGDFMRIGPFRRGNLSAFFMNCNRGKRAICIDLRKPEGREVLLDLVRGADVFVQNFRPGAVDRIGIGGAAPARGQPRSRVRLDQRLRRDAVPTRSAASTTRSSRA